MEHNPFVAPDVDPRAKQIQEARDAEKVGEPAATSLVPDWDALKALTMFMATAGGYTAQEVAEAVADPERFWEYMNAAKGDSDAE